MFFGNDVVWHWVSSYAVSLGPVLKAQLALPVMLRVQASECCVYFSSRRFRLLLLSQSSVESDSQVFRFVPLGYFPAEYTHIAVWSVPSDGDKERCTVLSVDGDPPGLESVFEIISFLLKASSDQTRIPCSGEYGGVIGVERHLGVCSRGNRSDPFGTPALVRRSVPIRNDAVRQASPVGISMFDSLCINPACQTMSNAFGTCGNTALVDLF